MTPDITQFFEGKEIRVVEQQDQVWFPLTDLTSAWGVHRNTLGNIIDRNEKKFNNHFTTIAHDTCAGLRAVNEQGLYLLIGAVNTDRMKNKEAADAILRFQRWVPELIRKYRLGELEQKKRDDNPLLESLNRNADLMDALVKRYDFDFKVARKLAMERVVAEYPEAIIFRGPTLLPAGSEPELALALPAAPDIPQDHDFEAMFTLTQIADFCKTNRNAVLKILEDEGIIYHSASHVWALTKKGEQYGKMFPKKIMVPGRTTEEMFAKYRPEARDLVLAKLAGEQATLGEGKA